MPVRAQSLRLWQEGRWERIVEKAHRGTAVQVFYGRGRSTLVSGAERARRLRDHCGQWYACKFEVRWDDKGRLRWYKLRERKRSKEGRWSAMKNLYPGVPYFGGLADRKLVTRAQAAKLTGVEAFCALDKLMEQDHPVHSQCTDWMPYEQRAELERGQAEAGPAE